MSELPSAGRAVLWAYAGIALGGLLTGTLSQVLRSRKAVVRGSLVSAAIAVAVHFAIGYKSLGLFYTMCGLMGLACGYWAVFVTMAAEQFGTNIRATVATTAPNFVRGAVVPMTMAFQLLQPSLGIQGSGVVVGVVTFAIALVALAALDETYGKDLNFVEE